MDTLRRHKRALWNLRDRSPLFTGTMVTPPDQTYLRLSLEILSKIMQCTLKHIKIYLHFCRFPQKSTTHRFITNLKDFTDFNFTS